MRELPRGTVTFLFSDIEGSTRLLHALGRERYVVALEAHRRILRAAFALHGGTEVDSQGDSFFVAFPYARDAVAAARDAQVALAEHVWDEQPVRVRMGLHTGEPSVTEGTYAGLDVHRGARVMACAHGGQILLSARTTDLIAGELPTNLSLRPVGTYLLKDFSGGEPLAQLDVGGLPKRFPSVRAEREPSPVARFAPRPVRRHPIVAGVSSLAAAGIAVALVLLLQPTLPAPQANALAEIDAGTAKLIGFVPVGDTPSSVVTANGSVWVTNAGEATVSRVDPRQRRVIRTIPVPGTPVGIVGGGGALWVINSDLAAAQSSVTRIDPRYARVTGTKTLPKSDLIGSGAGITWDGKSLWAVTQAGSAFQIDASTLHVNAIVAVGDDPTSVVAAKGSVWVANRRGSSVSRIQAPATVTQTVAVGSGPSAIAAGAGSIWVTDTGEDSVRRIDPTTGSVLATIPVGRGPDAIAVSDNAVWVANEDDRTVMRIDPRTNRVETTVHVGFPPAALSLAGGRVWVAVQKPTPPVPAEGQVLHVLSGAPGIIDSLDPPLAYTLITWQIEYSTCAKLLNYPDRPAPVGYQLEPEIARALPAVSHGGRTYTFRIRPGFRFSPPSSQAVTARTFKFSIERALAPGTKSFAVRFFSDIVGAAAYETGKAKHIAGVVARGNTLTISLERPSGDLPARVAMPFFCPVPIGTPADFRGLAGVPSAGPYYVASYTPSKSLILRPNPNYRGNRTRRFRAIEVRLVSSEEQADRIVEQENADLVIDEHGGIPIPKQFRWRLHHYPVGAVHYLVLNTRRPTFRSARERRAAALAIDRDQLAQFESSRSAVEGLLPPGFPGQLNQRAFGRKGDPAAARRLAGSTRRHAVYWTCDLPECVREATIVARQLARIHLDVTIVKFPPDALYLKISTPGARFDITDGGWATDYVDPADYLVPIATRSGITSAGATNVAYYFDKSTEASIAHSITLNGPERYAAFAAIEWNLRTKQVPYIATAISTRPMLFSSRVGCQVNNPVYGLDLGALCIHPR